MRKEYYLAHKDEINEKHRQYYREHKERIKQKIKEWQTQNTDKVKGYKDKYEKEHKEEKAAYQKEWRKTPIGRASILLSAYNQADKNMNRGKGDLTAQWIVDNIFTKPCAHCDETDWTKIGCNRLDDSKPHTKDNVEPCCSKCNLELQEITRDELGRFKKTNGE